MRSFDGDAIQVSAIEGMLLREAGIEGRRRREDEGDTKVGYLRMGVGEKGVCVRRMAEVIFREDYSLIL